MKLMRIAAIAAVMAITQGCAFTKATLNVAATPGTKVAGPLGCLGDCASPKLTTQNAMLGTPEYAAPEQLQASRSVSGKSDQYSLGVIIYEAATASNPFSNRSSLLSLLQAIDSGDYRKAKEVHPLVDERLEGIASRAMSVDPEKRFPSMLAFGAELLGLASAETQNVWARYFAHSRTLGESSASPRPSEPAPAPAPAPKRQSIGIGTALLLALAGFVATLLVATSASWTPTPRGEPLHSLRGEPLPARGDEATEVRAPALSSSSAIAPYPLSPVEPRGAATTVLAPSLPERMVAVPASARAVPPASTRPGEFAILGSSKVPKRASMGRRRPASESTHRKAPARTASSKTDNVDPWAR